MSIEKEKHQRFTQVTKSVFKFPEDWRQESWRKGCVLKANEQSVSVRSVLSHHWISGKIGYQHEGIMMTKTRAFSMKQYYPIQCWVFFIFIYLFLNFKNL